MEEVSKKIVQQAHNPERGQGITGEIKIPSTQLQIIKKEIKNISDFKSKITSSLVKSITEILETALGGAVVLGASDIHIEPKEDLVRLRIRIDGLLQDVLIFNLEAYQRFLNRIKLLSGIKLNITDRPQDGRFSLLFGENPIEIRVSTLPAEFGESIVLRVLDPKNLIDMEALGLRQDLLRLFSKEIKRPNGMIIVTGPTGSGKTTTLYAFLTKIQRPEIKIITIEDPIEYHLGGISQTQVNPKKGYDFANGLKSIMRQDPDVVLVGEVRDLETARTALQASLTGHLVFTTLHTNDAAGTVARLQALGEKPINIAPAINLIIAQRLVRKVCPKCSRLEKVTDLELKKIRESLKNIPVEIEIPKLEPGLEILRAKGCRNCNLTGYKGRTGIFESFLIDDEMEKFILTSPSIAALREEIIKKKMVPMYQDGLIKVLRGITTLEELERVIGQ